MPNQSGVWTLSQQFQARGQGLWPAPPGAPTIGTATAGSALCASVTFTAPGCTGYPAGITGYTVTSTPGCITKTGSSSPITVTGLTCGTSYTFKVKAQNASGFGPCSAASNSVTAKTVTCATYTTPGTYTWVAPAGVTSISAVAVGGGRGGVSQINCNCCAGGRGGDLAYRNNYSVTPGCSYTVQVGAGGVGGQSNATRSGGCASFLRQGATFIVSAKSGGNIGNTIGSGSGSGGLGRYGGGGAGGYTGSGGNGSNSVGGCGQSGSGGGGGGGYAMWYNASLFCCGFSGAGAGGGVGLYGQGANGAGATSATGGGRGGSGGANGGGVPNSPPPTQGAGYNGGAYGGGGGGGGYRAFCCCGVFRATPIYAGGNGAGGALRIIWPGTTRQFPSTNVGP